MHFVHLALAVLVAGGLPTVALAQSGDEAPQRLLLELNAVTDVDKACRLTFVTQNETGVMIERAVYEAVIFDKSGGVVNLSLFDFQSLPADRPRVRQFDVPGMSCDNISKALINGASSCVVNGVESEICEGALSLESRISVELLG